MKSLVLVHGLMGGSQQWLPQQEALCGFEVVAIDLPGFGANARSDALTSIADFADWVLNELSSQGVHRFSLIGHSMGGMVAQEMVARAPERVEQLILYGTGATGVLPGRFETIETSKNRAQAEGASATARRIAATWFLEKDQAPAYEGCARIAQLSRIEAILGGLDAMNGWNGTAHLPRITAKTLVIWGDGDRTYPWQQIEELWRSIKGASLAVIPGCAHAPHLEKPSLFNAVIADFLTD